MAAPTPADDIITEAQEGGEIYRTRIQELEEGALPEAENIVFYLRSVPADDKAKKRELARFFQTAAGGRYTKDERKSWYDALLGANRNRETIG